jgi:hypothetical protein
MMLYHVLLKPGKNLEKSNSSSRRWLVQAQARSPWLPLISMTRIEVGRDAVGFGLVYLGGDDARKRERKGKEERRDEFSRVQSLIEMGLSRGAVLITGSQCQAPGTSGSSN